MSLPETACVSIQGPQSLLDLGGFHWGDDIILDSTSGGLDADAGFKQSTTLLSIIVREVLVEKCNYKARDVMFFGFGQGGMTALNAGGSFESRALMSASYTADNLSVNLHQFETPLELGGVISVGAALPSEAAASLDPKCKTPVLVCTGSNQSSVTTTSEDKLKRVFEHVEVKRYRKPGDSMPSNRDEMMPIMQFFSRRLKSTKGVPEGSVEIG